MWSQALKQTKADYNLKREMNRRLNEEELVDWLEPSLIRLWKEKVNVNTVIFDVEAIEKLFTVFKFASSSSLWQWGTLYTEVSDKTSMQCKRAKHTMPMNVIISNKMNATNESLKYEIKISVSGS